MFASYHNHTTRCNHAIGTEREYLQKAVENEIKEFGFSDHTPMPFPNNYHSHMRMNLTQLQDYVETIQILQEEFHDKIEIHIGLEVEYYPKCFDDLISFLSDYPIEYMILGQHCLNNEYDGIWSGFEAISEKELIQYVDQTISAINTGKFTYLAHPDLINYKKNDDLYYKQMKRLCLKAKELKVPLEINLEGVRTRRQYPNPFFWQIVGEVGNEVVCGCDAHTPQNVYDQKAYQYALDLVKKDHLNLLESVTLIDPFK